MQGIYEELRIRCILEALNKVISQERKKLVIYPYGDAGQLTEKILMDNYGLEPEYIIDNKKYDGIRVLNMEQAQERGSKEVCVLICSFRNECYQELRDTVYRYFSKEQVFDIFPEKEKESLPAEAKVLSVLKQIDENLERMGIKGGDYKYPEI